MKSTIPGAGLPAGDFENKTSTAPKLELGLGAELGNYSYQNDITGIQYGVRLHPIWCHKNTFIYHKYHSMV